MLICRLASKNWDFAYQTSTRLLGTKQTSGIKQWKLSGNFVTKKTKQQQTNVQNDDHFPTF